MRASVAASKNGIRLCAGGGTHRSWGIGFAIGLTFRHMRRPAIEVLYRSAIVDRLTEKPLMAVLAPDRRGMKPVVALNRAGPGAAAADRRAVVSRSRG